MQFLKINPDARPAALAGCYVALADDAGAVFWNPAGITRTGEDKVHLQTSYGRYFGAFNLASFAATLRRGQQHFWGLYTYSLISPEMLETTEFQPFGTGRTFRSTNLIAGFTYARILTNSFSFGVNSKYAREAYADVAINNVLFDLGLHYNVGFKNARFAITISNFGLNVHPSGEVNILRFSGAETKSTFSEISVPALFRIGAALDPINSENHKLTLSAQLNHPTDNNETVSLGAEYLIRKVLAVRTGYEFGQDVKGFPPLGIGTRIQRKFGHFGLDYTVSHKQRLGPVHRVSLTVSLK